MTFQELFLWVLWPGFFAAFVGFGGWWLSKRL